MFEPGGLNTPATDIESIRGIRNELQQVFGLIADLESYGR
jgi:hypothetical protein